MALMIGEREAIPPEQWQVLRNTGTNHLMAIAGLHIGIMAGFAHVVVTWIWRLVPALLLHLPAQLAGASAALLMAIIYSLLAGFFYSHSTRLHYVSCIYFCTFIT